MRGHILLSRLVVGRKRRFAVLGAWLLLATALAPLTARVGARPGRLGGEKVE